MDKSQQITSAPQIHFDLDQMPKYKRDQLGKFVLDLVEKTFAIPGEEERYQAWLAERKKL